MSPKKPNDRENEYLQKVTDFQSKAKQSKEESCCGEHDILPHNSLALIHRGVRPL